jgi:hypothetical protein
MRVNCRVTEKDYLFIGNSIRAESEIGTVIVSGTSTNMDGESECSDIVINKKDAITIILHLIALFDIKSVDISDAHEAPRKA